MFYWLQYHCYLSERGHFWIILKKGRGMSPQSPPPPSARAWKCVYILMKDIKSTAYIHLDSNPISHWIKGLCCHLTALGGCKDMSWSPSTSVLPSFCPSYPLNPAVVSHIKPTIQFTYHIQLWAHGVLSSSATMTCKITYSVKEEWKWEKMKSDSCCIFYSFAIMGILGWAMWDRQSFIATICRLNRCLRLMQPHWVQMRSKGSFN